MEAAMARRPLQMRRRQPRSRGARTRWVIPIIPEDPLVHIRKQPIESVLTMQGSSRAGLTSEEAAQRQAREGKNLIESGKKRSPILAFLSNFTHLMAILLWVAGIIAFVAGMPELGCAVWLVNIINRRL